MDNYSHDKTMQLRETAFKMLKDLFKNEKQNCCGSQIGFVLYVIDCRATMCSGNIAKEASIEAIEEWLTSERAGKNIIPNIKSDDLIIN